MKHTLTIEFANGTEDQIEHAINLILYEVHIGTVFYVTEEEPAVGLTETVVLTA